MDLVNYVRPDSALNHLLTTKDALCDWIINRRNVIDSDVTLP
jgi:hypothetical protein